MQVWCVCVCERAWSFNIDAEIDISEGLYFLDKCKEQYV